MKLIVACDDKNGIGLGGRIPWRIPEDLARFKALTMRGTVIMGRRTWDSLPAKVRPLPGRLNVVVTRTNDWVPTTPSQLPVGDIDFLFDSIQEHPSTWPSPWVIGGGQVYAESMSSGLVTEIHLTRVEGNFGCDVFWPGVPEGWVCTDADPWPEHLREFGLERTDSWARSKAGPAYRFETWRPA